MDSKNKTIVSVLVLLAVILGAAIYFKYNPVPANTPGSATNNNPATSNSNTQVIPTFPTILGEIILTPDQKAMFNTPGPNATKAELNAFSTLVTKNAVAGNTITIKNCTASPDVLKIKQGNKFTVNNKGTTDIHFGFNTERTLIKAGASATITASYKNGPGIYGYGCDDKTINRAIGILMITP